MIYEFGPFRVDPLKRVLWRDGLPLQVTSKSLDTLLVLLEYAGQVVSKDELMKTLWPDTVVEENNLTQQISMLRKVLGEKSNEHRYVVTVPGRGYSFVAEVMMHQNGETNGLGRCSPVIAGSVDKPIANNQPSAITNRWSSIGNWQSALVLGSTVAIAAFVLIVFGVSWRRAQLAAKAEANRSIAVLPFKAINSDPTNVYLSTGMADALISRLSNLRQISVRPTSTIMKYADHEPATQMIGRELDVNSILEGTVQTAGDRVRVSVQLVNVHDGATMWARTFDQEMTDIFALQDSISEQVAQTMLVGLNGEDQKQIRKRTTANLAAYQEYLEGRYFWNARDKAGLTKSLVHFQRAIDLDAHYAQAYSGLADAYTLLVSYRVDSIPAAEAVEKARAAAIKALSLDESLAEAHASQAMIKSRYDENASGAEPEFRRAIELNPAYATAHHWYSEYLAMSGRETEALAEIKIAQSLDPLSPVINTTLGEHLYYAHRYDEAIVQLRKTIEISPNFSAAHFILGLALEQSGRLDEAIAELQQAKANAVIDRSADASLGHSYAVAGRQAEARKILHNFLASRDAEPYQIAMVYQGLGDKQQVMTWLEKISDGEAELRMMLRLDPRLDSLRSDPRFQELLRPHVHAAA